MIFLCFLFFCLDGRAKDPLARKPESMLAEILSEPAEVGSVFAQAKLDGVNYRKLLAGATRLNRKDLAAIFLYSGTNKLQGEGAETNIAGLRELLRLWGITILRTFYDRYRSMFK